MKARAQLLEGMTFVAERGSGHAIVVDAHPMSADATWAPAMEWC